METVLVLACFYGLLFTEALNDGLVHRFKVEKKKIYGYGHHIAQLFLIIAAAWSGAYLFPEVIQRFGLFSSNTGWLLLTYILTRIAFFDVFYNTIAGHEFGTIGTTDIWDITIKWILVQIGNFFVWFLGLFKLKFDARLLVMFYNIVKIGLAFMSAVWIDKHVLY